MSDSAELRGYLVFIELTGGEIVTLQVTSDPFHADTDGDGLDDAQERNRFSNPRSGDTDADLIGDYQEVYQWHSNATDQDSDDDTLNDSDELERFETSPILDDTDGDGLLDPEEVIAGNRNPRVSDLPEPGIEIGEVALRLDTRFSYTDTVGQSESTEQSTQATLTQSEQQTFSRSDTETTQHVAEAGLEAGYENGLGKVVANVGYTFTRENTFTASTESVEATQEEYQESLTASVTRDVTQEISRSVEDASVEVVVTISNYGDIPFTMSSIEITGLLQDPFNRSRFIPIATLRAASEVDGLGEFEVFLGPFIQERGPFIFKSTEVFPSLVEDLLKNPRGLIFKVANFDIVDEADRNFAFISQDVNDRTAGLIIDYGNGTVDRYRVATYSGFDRETEHALGISMSQALQGIIGLTHNGPVDAITVGPNGCGETWASGDDVQVASPICFPILPGGVIIEAGPNGVLETLPAGDDHKSDDGLRIVDGGDGCAHTRAARDDVQRVAGDCETAGLDGVMILAGRNGEIDTVPDGDDELASVTGYGTARVGQCDGNTDELNLITEPIERGNGVADSVAAADSDDVQVVPYGDAVEPGDTIVEPGPDGILQTLAFGDDVRQAPGGACITDEDCPGDGACRLVEQLVRVKGVKNVPEQRRVWVVLSPSGTDLGADFGDLRLNAGQTYSLAFVQDKDGDGLFAREEFIFGSSDRDDNSDGCPLGDGAVGCDTSIFDFDTIRDFDEVKTGWRVAVEGQPSLIAYANPVQPDTDADRLFDDEERQLGTDPARRDTDADEISDYDEVNGYDILHRNGELVRSVVPYQSAYITSGRDLVLDTPVVGDDEIGTGSNGAPIITSGANGLIDSTPDNDDELEGAEVILDGGNGIPETLASTRDVQMPGTSPTATRTVTVTYVDFQTNSDACDNLQDGEFLFDLRVAKNIEQTIGTPYIERAIVPRFGTHNFGGVIIDDGDGIANTTAAGDDVQVVGVGGAVGASGIVVRPGANGLLDTAAAPGDAVVPAVQYAVALGRNDLISISTSVIEDDPTCDADTTDVIVEPPGGGNGLADTAAVADDEQVLMLGTRADAGETIVRSCEDGVLDSMAGEPGICEAVIIRTATGDGTADTQAAPGTDDIQVIPVGGAVGAGDVVVRAGPNGRVDTVPAGTLERIEAARAPLACEPVIMEPFAGGDGTAGSTVAVGTDDIQVIASGAAVAAGDVIIAPGPNGVIDSAAGGDDVELPPTLPTSGGCAACPSRACTYECSLCSSGTCVGDDVVLARGQGDSCEAGWLGGAGDLCPCGRCLEVVDFDEWNPQALRFDLLDLASVTEDGWIISLTGGPGCFATTTLRVRLDVQEGVAITPGSLLVRPGLDGKLDTDPQGDDIVGVPHLVRFATNPLDRDTDGDTLSDGAERILGANPNNALDAQRFRDNDQDGLPNGVEADGWILAVSDSLGNMECRTANGYVSVADPENPPADCLVVESDPFEPDTDFDGLPDLLEYLLGSDPNAPDTDGEGILDLDEFDPDSSFSVDVATWREFQRRCADAPRCAFTPVEEPYGTSIQLKDTDRDGRTDKEELFEPWLIAPCVTDNNGNQNPGIPVEVTSSPLDDDFDNDGVLDGQEQLQGTDPKDPDTDNDGKVDSITVDSQPDGCGKNITVAFNNYAVQDDCDNGGDGEFRFRFTVITPAANVSFNQNSDNLDDNETHSFGSSMSTTFLVRPGQSFQISGTVKEEDPGDDEVWNFSRTYYYNDITTGQRTINPRAGEADDGCFDDHQLKVDFTVRAG